MTAKGQVSNKRKLSGKRVIARCQATFKRDDPFSTWNNVKTGHVVLNTRGGCFYLAQQIDGLTLANLFPDGMGALIKLTLSSDHTPEVVLENVTVEFKRVRASGQRQGIVFSFADITEEQLDILFGLHATLPEIGPSEEDSVMFDELMRQGKAPRLLRERRTR